MEILLMLAAPLLIISVAIWGILQYIHFVVARREPTILTDYVTGIAWLLLCLLGALPYFNFTTEIALPNQFLLGVSGAALIACVQGRYSASLICKQNLLQKIFIRSLVGPILSIILFGLSYRFLNSKLIDACRAGDVQAAVRWQSYGGALSNPSDWDLQQEINAAVYSRHTAVVRAYLKVGADPKYYGEKSWLIMAVHNSDYATAKCLIDYGAEINNVAPTEFETDTNNGKTALQIARSQGDARMIALLQAAGAKE